MKALVLLSGGMDSTVLLHYVHHRLKAEAIYVLSFLYGQRHRRELEMAKWQCRQVPTVQDHLVTDISFMADFTRGASALTDAEIPVPDLDQVPPDQRRQPATYVPNRNMIMLALAASYAESKNCPKLYYGAQAQDQYGYWDCTAEFIDKLNQVLGLNRNQPVEVVGPFVGWRKAEGLRLGLELGVDFSRTWTCYRGREKACGACPACTERLRAFAEIPAQDPLPYEAGDA